MFRSLLTFATAIACVYCIGTVSFSSVNGLLVEDIKEDLSVEDQFNRDKQLMKSDEIEPWSETNSLALGVRSEISEGKPGDCADLYDKGNRTSGIYTIYIGRRRRALNVYCDMTTSGGGWTVFQRRQDGTVGFYNGWTSYVNGFGSVSGEYWLGNKNIRSLTLAKQQTLRIDLTDFSNRKAYAEYANFKVGAACENYKLESVGTYCGNAGDSLTYHVGQMFSTHDRDNDRYSGSCASLSKGAWWYNNCLYSNLNGLYLRGNHVTAGEGVNWNNWLGTKYSLMATEMKIRPADFVE